MKDEQPIRNNFRQITLPLFLALAMAGGVLLGATIFGGASQKVTKGHQKIREILSLIEQNYVDSINAETLVDYSIDKLLEKLDPHSAYIPAKDLAIANSQLEADFDGIGVEFNLFRDTLFVIAPITGGPSEVAGIKAGDKIVRVDGKNIAGKAYNPDNTKIFKLLRGKRGTEVKLGILRRGETRLRTFNIKRDKIPTHSIEAALMTSPETGFIKVSRFSATTYKEFAEALQTLKKAGMKRLVIDLRDNPGGYLDKAVNMVDELLAGKGKIVYTKGKGKRFDSELRAKIDGIFEKGAVIVLVNEGSASAAEIMAGALQDHDRALLVGRRTFGKGLVQMPIDLADGSELRLTISRYYTPSGRCIQKPYETYENDLKKRFEKGEMYSKDSIKQDKSKIYTTTHGRKVYGGGGIVPDIFVAADSNRYAYLNQLYEHDIIREFALYYAEDNAKKLRDMGVKQFVAEFQVSSNVLARLQEAGKRVGIAATAQEIANATSLVKLHLKALIAKHIWKNEGFYPVLLQEDEIFQEAIKHFAEAEKLAQSRP